MMKPKHLTRPLLNALAPFALTLALSLTLGTAAHATATTETTPTPQSTPDTAVVQQYEQLAKQGDAQAQLELGSLYAKGLGVAQDTDQAIYWLEQAAQQGLVDAQALLGKTYGVNAVSNGIQEHHAKAHYWYKQAALQGDAASQFRLGAAYYLGRGTAKNIPLGIHWFEQAAAQNNAYAQDSLAVIYEYGHDGIRQDLKKALAYYQAACDNGLGSSCAAAQEIKQELESN